MCHSLNAPASNLIWKQPFFFITCLHLLPLLCRLLLLFTTSTHAQLLWTLVLSECASERVFVCHFIMTCPPPFFFYVFFPLQILLTYFAVNVLEVSQFLLYKKEEKSFVESQSESYPGVETWYHFIFCQQKEKRPNMLIIILLRFGSPSFKYMWFWCKYILGVGVAFLCLSAETREVGRV